MIGLMDTAFFFLARARHTMDTVSQVPQRLTKSRKQKIITKRVSNTLNHPSRSGPALDSKSRNGILYLYAVILFIINFA